ncbi:MAG: hypothetical protein JXB35_07280 [Anaerolineae bacterium]|nr:hypothetical protein [Anaerolineae bacterium]
MTSYRRGFVVLLALALCAVLASSVAAGSGYDLPWWTVDGGGMMGDAGVGYTLSGATGQSDAGVQEHAGYTLRGGFWNDTVAPAMREVFLPLLLKSWP